MAQGRCGDNAGPIREVRRALPALQRRLQRAGLGAAEADAAARHRHRAGHRLELPGGLAAVLRPAGPAAGVACRAARTLACPRPAGGAAARHLPGVVGLRSRGRYRAHRHRPAHVAGAVAAGRVPVVRRTGRCAAPDRSRTGSAGDRAARAAPARRVRGSRRRLDRLGVAAAGAGRLCQRGRVAEAHRGRRHAVRGVATGGVRRSRVPPRRPRGGPGAAPSAARRPAARRPRWAGTPRLRARRAPRRRRP